MPALRLWSRRPMQNCWRLRHHGFQRRVFRDGSFTSKTINGRRYWYFQVRTAEVAPAIRWPGVSPELLERIAHHRAGSR